MNNPTDKELLDTYMLGFNDELWNKERKTFTDKLLNRAYRIGMVDAIAGDDISSIDLQTDEEILKGIKNEEVNGC